MIRNVNLQKYLLPIFFWGLRVPPWKRSHNIPLRTSGPSKFFKTRARPHCNLFSFTFLIQCFWLFCSLSFECSSAFPSHFSHTRQLPYSIFYKFFFFFKVFFIRFLRFPKYGGSPNSEDSLLFFLVHIYAPILFPPPYEGLVGWLVPVMTDRLWPYRYYATENDFQQRSNNHGEGVQ